MRYFYPLLPKTKVPNSQLETTMEVTELTGNKRHLKRRVRTVNTHDGTQTQHSINFCLTKWHAS